MARLHEGYFCYTTGLAVQIGGADNADWAAQTFTTGAAYSIAAIKFKAFRRGTPGTLTVGIRATSGTNPTGSDLVSGTVSADGFTVSGSGVWYTVTFSAPYALSASTKYALVFRVDSCGSDSEYVTVKGPVTGTYSGGTLLTSTNSGGAWTNNSTYDMCFECYDSTGTIADGLQMFFKCNDNRANTIVDDSSGNANNGVASTNTENLTATGKIDNCFDFVAASSEYITGDDIANLDLSANQDITIAFWCYVDNVGTIPTFIHKWVTPNGWTVHCTPGTPTVGAYFVEAGGDHVVAATATGLTTGWHFVVARFDRDGCVSIDFDNGTASGENDISGHAATDLSNSHAIMIGENAAINANYAYYDGKIDCILGWNRIIGTDEITTIYNSGSGTETDATYGVTAPSGSGSLSDSSYSVKHVAVGNDCVYYQSATTTMSILDGSLASLDCNEALDMFSADGKVFIVNGAIKKVCDFRNTKIVTDNIGAIVPVHGEVLNGASGAQMVVDFITASSGACTVYGYRTTTTTFPLSDTVTGSACTGFTMTAVAEDGPPHYYNWTPYANDTATYGSMPAKATIAKWYFGRAVLSGNVQDPHQWYMTYVLNPWDLNYGASTADELRAIAGGYAAAGKIPDVQVAVIPYRDDYCIFGCASSCYYLTGNPTSGGEIAELKGTGGILSKTSWTWDAKGFLYLLTSMGLLRIPPGFGPAENLTAERWPNFITDLAYNSSTQRLTMGFDQKRNGIEISRTTVVDGDNTCWWYDLNTEGLFPESYPDAQGFFSQYYSESAGKLILGGFDGYLRHHDDSTPAKNDDGTAIDAYFTLGPLPLGNGPSSEGTIGPVEVILAGGAASGSETDSDDAGFKIFTADTAAELIEDMYTNGVPAFGGTANGPGRLRGGKRSQTARGIYGGIRIWNSTLGEAFIFECCNIGAAPKGRGK